MKAKSLPFLCVSASLTVALAGAGCSSHRSARNTNPTTTTTAGTTTTASGTTPRTDEPMGTARVDQAQANADRAQDIVRLNDAMQVFQEVMATPDKAIPQQLLDKAQCVAIVPGLKKGAFVVGAQYGKGFFSCRNASNTGWTAPAAIKIEGGSFGFQIGGQETDVVMLVMNPKGEQRLLSSQFTIGADAAAAAGPVGRNAQANTDLYMTAEILSWSRSRGAFAGVSLQGATLREDLDDNRGLYGRNLTNKEIIEGNTQPPQDTLPFVEMLTRYSPRQTS